MRSSRFEDVAMSLLTFLVILLVLGGAVLSGYFLKASWASINRPMIEKIVDLSEILPNFSGRVYPNDKISPPSQGHALVAEVDFLEVKNWGEDSLLVFHTWGEDAIDFYAWRSHPTINGAFEYAHMTYPLKTGLWGSLSLEGKHIRFVSSKKSLSYLSLVLSVGGLALCLFVLWLFLSLIVGDAISSLWKRIRTATPRV